MDLYQKWVEVLPAVEPFYAIKSNPDPALLKMLGALGTGFDCASKVHKQHVITSASLTPTTALVCYIKVQIKVSELFLRLLNLSLLDCSIFQSRT